MGVGKELSVGGESGVCALFSGEPFSIGIRLSVDGVRYKRRKSENLRLRMLLVSLHAVPTSLVTVSVSVSPASDSVAAVLHSDCDKISSVATEELKPMSSLLKSSRDRLKLE